MWDKFLNITAVVVVPIEGLYFDSLPRVLSCEAALILVLDKPDLAVFGAIILVLKANGQSAVCDLVDLEFESID